MDQRALFDVVMQLQAVMPPLRENNRARSAIDTIKQMLSVQEEPFIYTANFTSENNNALGPGVQATVNVNIQADADFRVLAGAYEADVDNASQVDSTRAIFFGTVLLTDTGSGRAMMDQSVPVSSLFGTGELPFPWPMPKVMRARSTLQVQVLNPELINTYNLRLAFIGVKLYPLG